MGFKQIILFNIMVFTAYKLYFLNQQTSIPKLDPNPWWGSGKPKNDDPSVKEYKINISQQDLDDLKSRLSLPLLTTPALESSKFTYGFPDHTTQKLIDHWKKKYDWRAREKKLNTYKHYKTQIEGLDIHFMRATPENGKNNIPLLLVHGWPGSFVEFIDILPLLTKSSENTEYKDIVFDVICPSLPGYGFSQGSSKIGLGAVETAQIFLKLMQRLGFDKFYVQGGDWGSLVASSMASLYPENILGMHLNMVAVNTPSTSLKLLLGSILPTGILVPESHVDRIYPLSKVFGYLIRELGYMHLQATKPDTIGTVLQNSPVGLAVYIMEKFSSWTHKENINKIDGGLFTQEFPIDLDKMLDNICVYWFSRSITTSVRYYAENFSPESKSHTIDSIPTEVPSGFADFRQEIFSQPENFISAKYKNILSYKSFPVGGHFAAMERPDLLAADIKMFVKKVQKLEDTIKKSEL